MVNDSNEWVLSFCQKYPSTLESLTKFVEICSPNSSEFKNVYIDEFMKEHQDVEYSFLIIIVSLYVLMITVGCLENFIVILIFIRHKLFHIPRNSLILNLAISDLILCTITQPFNLLRFLTFQKGWNFGSFNCKFSAIFSGTNIFVSTISITVITIDRFQLIIHPTKSHLHQLTTFKAFFMMWFISIILASPMVYFTTLESFTQPNTNTVFYRCTEYDPNILMKKIKLAYSIMSLIIQYVAPLLIVIIVYAKIFLKIKHRMVNKSNNLKFILNKGDTFSEEEASSRMVINAKIRKQALEEKRQRRTNILLVLIAMIFALSWLPLNIMNLIMDIILVDPGKKDSNNFFVLNSRNVKYIQAICLLIVLCSACTNPLLYSWLNVTFKEKLKHTLCKIKRENINLTTTNSCFIKSFIIFRLGENKHKLSVDESEKVPFKTHNNTELAETINNNE